MMGAFALAVATFLLDTRSCGTSQGYEDYDGPILNYPVPKGTGALKGRPLQSMVTGSCCWLLQEALGKGEWHLLAMELLYCMPII